MKLKLVGDEIEIFGKKSLEPGGVPNSDKGIFESLEMYKKDFELTSEQYLDVVADEAIFRRIIKLTDQWPYLRPILE
uniref:Uncharacterized protein n=1 Tax=Rhizophagus irregularis (strain DAOM 181602 / DAOM 197198 / MUCL 43194) TaxID=747089 RepID=U9SZE4_RHIID